MSVENREEGTAVALLAPAEVLLVVEPARPDRDRGSEGWVPLGWDICK